VLIGSESTYGSNGTGFLCDAASGSVIKLVEGVQGNFHMRFTGDDSFAVLFRQGEDTIFRNYSVNGEMLREQVVNESGATDGVMTAGGTIVMLEVCGKEYTFTQTTT